MQKVISKKEIKETISNKNVLNEKSLRFRELRELSEGLQNYDESQELDESWERLKYLAARYLPSYKVGDRILGGAEERRRMQQEIQRIMDNEAEGFLTALDADIQNNNPEFPNNQRKEDFLRSVLGISAVYDSIIAATQRQNNPITAEQANEYIDNLRKYVNYMMSYKLNRTIYSTMNENYDESEDIQLSEGSNSPYVEYHSDRRNVVGDKSMGELDEATEAGLQGGLSSASVKRALAADRTARGGMSGEDEFGSEVMTGLKSNRLPVVLASIGAGLGALGWVAQTDWLREILEFLFNKKEVVGYKNVTQSIVRKLAFNVENGDGFTQTVNKTLGLSLGPNTTTDQFLSLMKQKGFGSTAEEIARNYGIGGLSPNPRFVGDAALALNQKGALLKDVFEGIMHGKAGTLMAVNPGPFLAKQIATRVVKAAVIKTTTTGTAMALGLSAAAPWLIGTGIGLLAAGALVKLMRMKGQKSSRAATLNTLLQSLRPIAVPTTAGPTPPSQTPPGQTPPSQTPPTSPSPTKKTPLSNLRKVLRNLFSNVYTVQTNPNLLPEAVKKGPNYIKQGGLEKDLIGFGDDLDKKNKSVFIKNMRRMMAVAKAINSINTDKLGDDALIRLLQNVKQDGLHDVMTDINGYIDNNKIKNAEFVKSFIIAYNQAIQSSTFQNLKDELDKNLDTLLEAVKPNTKAIEQLKEKIINYFTKLFLLFKKVNELAAKENNNPAPAPSNPTPTPAPSDDFQTRANMGSNLEESKKKKKKYSKKASEFIGKEISHLKKDKGYPQERAVAAAINVAKEKGMKVGSKKKVSTKKKSLKEGFVGTLDNGTVPLEAFQEMLRLMNLHKIQGGWYDLIGDKLYFFSSQPRKGASFSAEGGEYGDPTTASNYLTKDEVNKIISNK